MLRLSLMARIGVLAILSLVIVWTGSVVLFYLSAPSGGRDARPLPAQVAALTQLLEHSRPEDRDLLLRAVNSQSMTVRIEPGLHIGATQRLRRIPRLTARAVNEYLNAIGGRPISVTLAANDGEAGGNAGFSLATPINLELRVGLTSGETLIVDETRTPGVNMFGLPVGFVVGLFGTFVGLSALILMHRETKPLARLAAAVDRIDLAAPPVPIPETRSSAPEIRALQAAFNRLHGRLSGVLRARLALLGGISHDVRTFATRLRLRVDHIPREDERERATADIEDMVRLLDDALLASRAGAGELAEELIEFGQMVREEIDDRWAEGALVDFNADADALRALVLGDRVALRRVVANLIDNALKYGVAARVSVGATTTAVTLTVDDDGPGIPRDRRDEVLEPFVRLEGSRSRRTGGAGLGLAIARDLVDAHRGTLAIGDVPAGGARLTVQLPRFRA
jgi:signal transduction histidine kinase